MQKTFKSMILDKGGWFPINCEVIRDTSPTAAILFFFLINMDDRHADSEGWFYAKNNYLSEQLGFKKDALKNAFDLLHLRGYLGVKAITGYPNGYKILRYESTETVGVAENPHTPTENKNNPAVFPPTPALNPPPLPCVKPATPLRENLLPPAVFPPTPLRENLLPPAVFPPTPLRENLLPPAVFPPTPCGLDAYPPAGNPHTNKEYTNKELISNNKNKELIKEESADFTNPLPLPAPKKPVSKKSKVWFSAERVKEIVFGLIQQFYPNQSKGWADLLNEYFNNVKSAKTKSKNETAFLKTVQRDAEKFLAYCSATQISDSAIIVYLEQATEREYLSLTGWSGKSKGGEAVNFTTTLQGIGVLEKTHAKALSTTQQDPRNTNELMRLFVDKILTVYDKIGAVRGGEDADAIKQQHLNYYEQIKGKLSTDPEKFKEQLVWVAECLKAEYKELESKTTATYKPKGMAFDMWISKSYWENHAPIKATQIKAQQPQKIAPIAPKVATVEQTPETPIIVQQGENKAVLKVLSAPTAPAKLEDAEANYPDFYFEQEAAEDRTETIQRIRHSFLIKLAKVERVMDNKRKGLIEILQLEKIYTGDDFCLFLHDVCEGFPTESANVNAWIFLREFWDKQLAPKVCTAQKISIN